MRILAVFLGLLAVATAAPPTSVELRARYGEPYVERFTVLRNAMVTVQYGADGKALSPEIDRGYWLLGSLFLHTSTTLQEAVEAGPMVITMSTCAAIESRTYEGELVSRSYNACDEALEDLLIRTDTLQRTSAELHARYGRPDVERFRVRPDVRLTAEYGPDDQACAMRIESVHDLTYPLDAPAAPVEEVLAVLDEVVPPQARGKEIGSGEKIWGACSGAALPAEYENVTISSPNYMCDPHSKVRGIDIHFKRSSCDAFRPRRIPESQ